MKRIDFSENGLNIVFEINDKNEIKLLHFSALPFEEKTLYSLTGTEGFRLVEVMVTGEDRPGERHGTKYVRTSPGQRLKLRDFSDTVNEKGRKLEITTFDDVKSLAVVSYMQFYAGIPVVRCWTELINEGGEDLGIEYVSSFALTGLEKEGLLSADEKLRLDIPYNAWQKEMQWVSYRMADFGMTDTQRFGDRHSSQVIEIGNTGNWSTKRYLPMGILKNEETESTLFWQIEQNGSWYWEISDQDGYLYLQLSGPTEHQSGWWKCLKPGERFVSVPVAAGSVIGDMNEVGAALTQYRRMIRRPNQDNIDLPVIFNDYMNCLFGDPTTEKELPMIDKAAADGCEYYVIDAGWYSKDWWWDSVGEWLPSKERFPDGLKNLLSYIREKGMVPGLWLELEVMGIKCRKAGLLSDDCYFVRHGKKICDRSRYQLDFRNPKVIAHADEVIDRLVQDYGVGYIKMDYNIEPGVGTEINADSYGDGLLSHNRAYLSWLESVFRRYPDLVIENCSSGGLRMDYAMLSRYSIQSTSDTEDYRCYASIAANCPMALTPEQAAVWSYPLTDGDEEETIFNMINALLLRIHQSGHLVNLSKERSARVQEAIRFYKQIRSDIRIALPFWPIGLSSYEDPWVSMGLRTEKRDYLAVWRRSSTESKIALPVSHRQGQNLKVTCAYPENAPVSYCWNPCSGMLTVELPNSISARLFRLETEEEV